MKGKAVYQIGIATVQSAIPCGAATHQTWAKMLLFCQNVENPEELDHARNIIPKLSELR